MLQGFKILKDREKRLRSLDYENVKEENKRKNVLLSEIPQKFYKNVLDIGCGKGFITLDLPGENILGIDNSLEMINNAKNYESNRLKFQNKSLYDIWNQGIEKFDIVIITDILYPQNIGNSLNLVYLIIDELLNKRGVLISVHVDEWYKARFPYLLLKEYFYNYKEYTHRLEVYIK